MTIPVGRRSKGPRKVGASNIGMRVPPDQLAPLDAYVAAQPDPKPGRPEAIRMILGQRFSWLAEAEDISDADWHALRGVREQGTNELCRLLDGAAGVAARAVPVCAIGG